MLRLDSCNDILYVGGNFKSPTSSILQLSDYRNKKSGILSNEQMKKIIWNECDTTILSVKYSFDRGNVIVYPDTLSINIEMHYYDQNIFCIRHHYYYYPVSLILNIKFKKYITIGEFFFNHSKEKLNVNIRLIIKNMADANNTNKYETIKKTRYDVMSSIYNGVNYSDESIECIYNGNNY